MSRLATLGFTVGLPLLGIATAETLKAQESYNYRSTTRTSDRMGQLCSAPGPELQDVCETRAHLNVLELGSASAGLFGISLMWGISIAGISAQKRRSVYLRWAESGLRSIGSGAVLLTALQAAVLIAAIGHAGRALFGDYNVEFSVVLAVGAACWVIAMTRGFVSLIQPVGTSVIGTRLDPKQGPQLYQRVEQLSLELGALPPTQIVVGLEPGFFTTDADVTCVDGTHVGRTLYCALPLIRIVSLRELDALIAHELLHPETERARVGEARGSIALLPALPLLDHFEEAFATAHRNHEREREIAADRDAVSIAGPVDVASASVKAHTMTELMARIQRAAPTRFGKGQAKTNICKAAAELAIAKGNILPVAPKDSAIALIENVEALEESLSARYEFPLRKSVERRQVSIPRRTALILVNALLTLSAGASDAQRVDATSKRLLGIPIETLDSQWAAASLISKKNLPNDSREDLLADNDTAYRFKADGDFNGDGRRDRAVVGVYRTHDGKEGQFLLIVTKKRPGAWTATYLSKNTGFAGPSLLYPEAKRLNWVPCTACEVGAKISWKRDRYKTEWVRTDR